MKNVLQTIIDNFWIYLIIFGSIIYFLFANRIRGYLGEIKTGNILNKLPRKDYKVLNDLMLFSDNKTHQIDHVVISHYGIFVIEMKNYMGKEVGNEFKDKWTQYIGSKTNTFYNPVKQNYGHLRCISDVLDMSMNDLIPVVVFSNETEIMSECEYVINLKDMIKYIRSFKAKKDIDIEKIYDKLVSLNITDSRRSKHVSSIKSNIKKDNKKVEEGLCPKCGSKLIDKNKYYACSKCKYTKDK